MKYDKNTKIWREILLKYRYFGLITIIKYLLMFINTSQKGYKRNTILNQNKRIRATRKEIRGVYRKFRRTIKIRVRTTIQRKYETSRNDLFCLYY